MPTNIKTAWVPCCKMNNLEDEVEWDCKSRSWNEEGVAFAEKDNT